MGQPLAEIYKGNQGEKNPIDEQTSDASATAEEGGKKRSVKCSRGTLICTGIATAIVVLLVGGLILLGFKMAQKYKFEGQQECHRSCDACLGKCDSLPNRSLASYFNCSEKCRAVHSERCNEHCTIQAGEHLRSVIRQFDNKLLLQSSTPINATHTARANLWMCANVLSTCAASLRVCQEHCNGEWWFTKPVCLFNCSISIINCIGSIVGCSQ